MKKIKEEELKNIYGGAISASFITAIVKGLSLLLELGRSVGTAVRRNFNGTSC